MTYPGRPAAVLAIAGFVVGCSQEAVESRGSSVRLRLQYEVGDSLRYRYHLQGTIARPDTMEGHPARESFERTIMVDEVATEVTPGGNYVLAWRYHLPKDAARKAERDVPSEFALEVEITPQGRIVDVGDLGAAREVLGNLDFKTYLDQTQPVFPDRTLKVGDSWTQEVRVLSPTAEPVVTRSTYVLEALDNSIAVIAFDGDVYLPVTYEAADTVDDRTLRSSEERIRVRGKLHFDHERGITRRVVTSAQATVTKVSVGPDGPSRRNVEISQQTELSLVSP